MKIFIRKHCKDRIDRMQSGEVFIKVHPELFMGMVKRVLLLGFLISRWIMIESIINSSTSMGLSCQEMRLFPISIREAFYYIYRSWLAS